MSYVVRTQQVRGLRWVRRDESRLYRICRACFGVPNIFPQFFLADIFVQVAIGIENGFAQFVEREAAARTLHLGG